MNNFLPNGTVLPSNLLSHDAMDKLQAFRKTYQNNSLKVGIVIKTYSIKDSGNIRKVMPEYDVLTFEQDEDKGSTVTTYKNCIDSSSLGSIADFFEKVIRQMDEKSNNGTVPTPNGQDGSMVLLLCLNGSGDSGIIVGSLGHPDRKTTLVDAGPRLEGEYNGVNIKVEKDGSTSLTFRGATDSYGDPLDKTQGDTVMSIEKDGTFQTKHAGITQRLQKDGKASLTANDDISNTTQKSFNISASENIIMSSSKNTSLSCVDLAIAASGNATLECQKATISAKSELGINSGQVKIQAESMAMIKGSNIVLDGNVSLGGQGGQPLLLMSAMILGTGNLGLPVISAAISGFTTKVTAQ